VLAALQQVALAYLDRDGSALPFWRMATEPVEALRARAERLRVGAVVDCASVTGGGTLPGVEIPSVAIALDGDRAERLRQAGPKPVIARVEDGRTLCDLRTVAPADDQSLGATIEAAK
jgi:L-seryl-tRNA(Ser) seleniumtransferase